MPFQLRTRSIHDFPLYAATRNRELSRGEKGLLATAAIGTFVVDGWLLYRFTRERAAAQR